MNIYDDWAEMPWRLWDDLLGGFSSLGVPGERGRSYGRYPRVNAWEREDELIMEAMIPGIDSSQVEVSVEGSDLTLEGPHPAKDAEGREQRFERRFELPFTVDPAKVKAKFKDGILTVTLPKAETARRQTIAIEG